MKINSEVERYLTGNDLSNGYFFSIGHHRIVERNDLLTRMVKNKCILHLGCADHIDLIFKKKAQGIYLHDLLAKSAKRCFGADTNTKALHKMKLLGIKDLYQPNRIPDDIYFDITLVPDVIEHIPNVHTFLQNLKKIRTKRFVITTPNAYRLRNRILLRNDLINTDHRYWFSPYTLSKTVYEAGFIIENFFYTDSLSFKNPIKSFLKWRYPICRDGLAIVIRPMNQQY